MQFESIALIACAMVTGIMASPLITREEADILTPNEYTELYREPASNGGGFLVYYGPSDDTKTPRAEDRTAGCAIKRAPVCSVTHTARNDICDQLVTELQGDSQIAVGTSPRQICYEGAAAETNAYCCVSWHNVVPGLHKGDLAGFANTMLATCTANGISGKTYNVRVASTCTDVCLSNRGTGC